MRPLNHDKEYMRIVFRYLFLLEQENRKQQLDTTVRRVLQCVGKRGAK